MNEPPVKTSPAGWRRIARGLFGKRDRTLFALLLVVYAFFSFQGLCGAFLYGHEGFNGAQRSTIARNYVRYGVAETRGRPHKDFGYVASAARRHVHWHHPPLANLMIFWSFELFGESEAAARVPVVLLGIVAFWAFYRAVHLRHGGTIALSAASFYTFLPIRFTYGNLVNYEVGICCFVLLSLWLLERRRAPAALVSRRWNLVAITAALLVAGMIDWPAYILAFMVAMDALLRKPRQPAVFVAIGVGTTALLLLTLWWLSGSDPSANLMWLAKYRSGGTSKATFAAFAERIWSFARAGFGLLPLAAAGGWILTRSARGRLDPLVAVFLLGTAIYFLLFRQAAMKHDFYLYFLIPAVAVGSGAGVVELVRLFKARFRPFVAVAVAAAFVAFETPTLLAATDHSHGVRDKGEPKRFPRRTHLDTVILGRKVRELSHEGDVVVLHRSVRPTTQLGYYMARNYRSTHRVPDKGSSLFIAKARSLSARERKQLAADHPVTWIVGYLIVDLSKKGSHVTVYRYRAEEPSLWWRYAHSNHYPPFEMVRDPKASAKYAKKLGVKQ